jgi:hypothetical protein
MHIAAWDRTDLPQLTVRERAHNATVFVLWFVFGSRVAKRLTGRDR